LRKLFAVLSVGIFASCVALAQSPAKPADARPVSLKAGNPRSAASAAKTLTVVGRVADDGKAFLTDIDTEWAVSNADALKGYEGRLATVKCYVDPESNRLRVVSVRTAEDKYASRQGDSAFRR